MEKYAVYVRVSTDRDEQVSSVENQIDICRNWIERNEFIWDEGCIYKDEGISGTLLIERPAIQAILQKAKRQEITMVIFKSISRLARDLKDALEIREVLTAHKVRIISVEEGFDSNTAQKNDMAFEIWSMFSAQYSRTLSSSISAALAAKVRRGEHIGKVPYGYDRIDQKLVINEEEAEVIRKVYIWYNMGWGFKRITNELNKMEIKPKKKSKWQVTSVQRIIRNPIYKGTFILNQYTKVKVGGRKKQIRNPKDKWLVYEKHHPAIISEEVWAKANSTKYKSQKTKITPWNEFRNLTTCGACGSRMVIVQSYRNKASGERVEWKYLKCSKYRRSGKYGCVNHVPIKYEAFRQFVINLLVKKGEYIILNFENKKHDNQEKQKGKWNQQIRQCQEKGKYLVDLYIEGLIDKEEFKTKRRELNNQIKKANHELSFLTKESQNHQCITTVKQALGHLESQSNDLFHMFHTLIEKIIIHQDGEVDITYKFEDRK